MAFSNNQKTNQMNRIQTLAAALFLFSFGSFSQSTGNDLPSNTPLLDEKGNPIIITNADGSKSYVFPITEEQAPATNDVPLMDENGNPIIIELENGMKSFVFPEVEND